ncbi:MAG: NADH-quinone oxidoreductase subunit N, partial [Candidatus Stahlbacteria bacterium]|nr:NADH-quinone oxidoreductase subunit N [Candidatus Stahlbacteria bacterium]
MVEFGLIKLELLVCGIIGLIFIVDLFSKSKTRLHTIAVIGSLGLLVFSFLPTRIGTTFFDSYSCDYLSIFFRSIFCLSAFIVILLSIDFLKTHSRYTGEYYILIFSATLGMILLSSAQEMLTFYVSLELLSISSYILAAYKKSEPRSVEAGIKYFLLGAIASAILLFGISFVYGSTGTTQFKEIGTIISSTQASPILYIGLVLILCAMCFKIAVVPLHMWAPDVYEGAPTPIVAFFSIGTKAAGFAILMRIFLTAFYGLKAEWGMLMVVLSAMTMILGNLAAIPQTNIKRLLGYSTIAQAGYILMGIAMASYSGIAASMYYLVAYLFSNLCAFAVIIIFSNRVGSVENPAASGDKIEDYSGLSHRSPGL